jgi:putative transposase
MHVIWSLPEGDADFSLRWSLIEAGFSCGLAGDGRAPQARSDAGGLIGNFGE